MITQDVKEIYRCSHCYKLYLRKHACINHEKVCKGNPDNRPKCFDYCKYLEKRELEVKDRYAIGFRKFDTFYCTQTETFMHTPVSEAKGKPIEKADGTETVVMPKNCKHYKPVHKEPF